MIAVDWGNSSLRAYRLAADGAIAETRRADLGALDCADHGATLAAQIHGWDDADIVLCGAIGGRGGWHEVPYVECPARATALAAGLLRFESDAPALRGRTLRVVPGVLDLGSAVADTMRGEETKVVGLLHSAHIDEATVCMPGTHGKWVRVRDGAIVSIHTAMTGEVYALMRHHGILSRLMAPAQGHEALDTDAFDAGLERSRHGGGLLHHLFGVRTQALVGRLAPEQAPSYLSGILVGHEIQPMGAGARHVHLIAGERLRETYARALAAFGIPFEHHPETLAAAGIHALATLA